MNQIEIPKTMNLLEVLEEQNKLQDREDKRKDIELLLSVLGANIKESSITGQVTNEYILHEESFRENVKLKLMEKIRDL